MARLGKCRLAILAAPRLALTTSLPAATGQRGQSSACSPRCAGATSGRTARAAPGRRPGMRASRTPSIWRRSTAASGRRPTPAAPGRRSSTTSRPARSASIAVAPSDPERHLRRQRRRAAPAGSVDRRRRLQVDRRRQDVDASRPARRAADSRTSPSIRATRIGCSSPRSAIPTARTRSAASSARPTAARSFQKVLFKDENTGGNDVDIDPSNPDIVYATMWEERQGPWENARVARHGRRHLQVDRRRHDVEAADQRAAADGASRRTSRSRRANPKRLYAAVAGYDEPGAPSDRGAAASIAATMPARRGRRSRTDTRPAGRIGGGDLPMPIVESEGSRHR